MTVHELSAEVALPYTTPCKEDNLRYKTASGDPPRYRWSDFPSGVVDDFKDALLKLEQMVYAIFGSVPYYEDYPNVGDDPIQWDDTLDPRTYWPHLTEYCFDAPDSPSYCKRDCLRGVWRYLSMGEFDDHGLKAEIPQSPIRSRSGNPVAQFLRADHARWFGGAAMSDALERSPNAVNCSKSGTDDFDADSKLIHKNYTMLRAGTMDSADPAALDTTITVDTSMFTPDAGWELQSVAVIYKVFDVSSQTWGVEQTASGSLVGGILTATIPPQSQTRPNASVNANQGSTVIWCVRATFQVASNPSITATVYDPHDSTGEDTKPASFSSPPATDSARAALQDRSGEDAANMPYAYVCFRHYNPYRYGFPEMWDTPRKGTDAYQFNQEEEIQPALINMIRWACDHLGKSTTHKPDGKSAKDPYTKAQMCCMNTPIRFYWSGSNVPDLYIPGGKTTTGANYVPDLVCNDPDMANGAYGDVDARKSWRGRWLYWATDDPQDDDELDYADFGNINHLNPAVGESWMGYGTAIRSIMEINKDFDYANWERGAPGQYLPYGYANGLREGDVIDVVHISELTAAIEYLWDNGFWVPVKTGYYPASKHVCPSGDPASIKEVLFGENYAEQSGGGYDWEDSATSIEDEGGNGNGGCYHTESIGGITYYYAYATPDCSQTHPNGCRRCSNPSAYLDSNGDWIPTGNECGTLISCTRSGLCFLDSEAWYTWDIHDPAADPSKNYQTHYKNWTAITGVLGFSGGTTGDGNQVERDGAYYYKRHGDYHIQVTDSSGWFCGPPETKNTPCTEQARANWIYGNGMAPSVYDPCSGVVSTCGASSITSQFPAGSMGNKFDDLVHCFVPGGANDAPTPTHINFETPYRADYQAPRGILDELYDGGRSDVGSTYTNLSIGSNPRLWSADGGGVSGSPVAGHGAWIPVCIMNGSSILLNNWPSSSYYIVAPQYAEHTFNGGRCSCSSDPNVTDCHDFEEHVAAYDYVFELSGEGQPCNYIAPDPVYGYVNGYDYCMGYRLRWLTPECDIRNVWCRVEWFSGTNSESGFNYLTDLAGCDDDNTPRPFDRASGYWGYPVGFNLVLPFGNGLCRGTPMT